MFLSGFSLEHRKSSICLCMHHDQFLFPTTSVYSVISAIFKKNEYRFSFHHRFVLVENIPEDVSIPYKGTIPLNAGLHELLDQAHRFVEIVSPWWSLNSSKNEFELSQAKQVISNELHHYIYIVNKTEENVFNTEKNKESKIYIQI